MDPVRYRILGTTQALRSDGTPLPVGGARLRALLTVLALRPGRTVTVGLLVAEVWGGDPPADAPAALQALVGRLRRALGADAVASVDGGYRLVAAPDDIDLHRFDRLTGEGARALADGDATKAAGVLDDALALWRGPALADLPDHTAESARWEARRLDALRARHTAALALGHAEQSLPELTALCDSHPLDEPLQALRLRALRDAGRTAEALAAYEDVRQSLADRLGADPGPELRALHGELLANGSAGRGPAAGRRPPVGHGGTASAGPTAGWGPAAGRGSVGNDGVAAGWGPAAGQGPVGDHGAAAGRGSVGDDGVAAGQGPGAGQGPVAGQGAAAAGRWPAAAQGPVAGQWPAAPHDPVAPSPSVASADVSGRAAGGLPGLGNLRARLTSFVGREADIEAIRGDLAAARLVTLLGPGGAGKTRLSQEAAETVRDVAPDGVWLVELAPVDDPDDVPQAVLTAVGARETVLYGAGAEAMRAGNERHDDPVERLVEHCGRRRMLLILDNCEHVVEAAARLTEALLERCPQLTVLATSRESLGVPGELLRPVDPLPEPVALRLLADRGAAARPGFRVEADEETAAACAEICRRLDGLPLGIELAAARLRMLTPRQIADRLDDRFRLLTSGSRTLLPRQQTLRAVVDWSWELLDEGEREVLRRLSVFAGGCDLAAAEAVCGPVALDALGSLVDKSLVVAAPSESGEMRYRLLETVAEYAAERLDESGRRAEAGRAHLTYYRELARTTDQLLRGPGQLAAIGLLEREYENLRTALRLAVAERDEQEGLCLVLSLGWYWQMRDLKIEARTWSREIMALGPDPFPEPVRPARPVWQRCTDTPPPWTGEVLEEARRGLHLTHLACMDTELEAWQNPAAQAKLRSIAQTYEPGMPQTCRIPGSLWLFAVMLTGDMERLRLILDETVRTSRETPGYDWELAASLQWRANLFAHRIDWEGDALADADEALEIYERLGDLWGTAEALAARAESHERKGRWGEAAADYEAGIDLAGRLGARAQQAVLKARLGSVLMESEPERGELLLREVLASHDGGHNEALPAARLFLSARLAQTGRVAEAREQVRLLREEFGISHFIIFDAFILGAEAHVEAAAGAFEACLDKVRQALGRAEDPLSQAIAPHMRAQYLHIAALGLAGAGGRAADGARCLAAGDALLPAGRVMPAYEREPRERAERQLRALLGDAAYATAYDEGAGLSPGEAAALV
ncbi:AfsR/SARP family transcriptional regulator [Streptomyces aquilus]|uniref:AfsR/SARP family transcriptional regulator n=1 Tax=Streptomyces aquilus TaxID=2548456 RepID=A0A3S9HYZ5_9ACTN|nr:BTAD domain-containing putative transcriptional regulator [Streptomyces aquilus]AZP17308.1 AfsR/SARP family transcriptional regulator [Streptomyces aquilus]